MSEAQCGPRMALNFSTLSTSTSCLHATSLPQRGARQLLTNTKCLCSKVCILYRELTRAGPRKADRPHRPEVCPLGWQFAKVALWPEWFGVRRSVLR